MYFSPLQATCPVHLIPLDVITLIRSVEIYTLQNNYLLILYILLLLPPSYIHISFSAASFQAMSAYALPIKRDTKWTPSGALPKGRAAKLLSPNTQNPQNPQNRNLKSIYFVDIAISNVLRDISFI
jgi:hypothetical protein